VHNIDKSFAMAFKDGLGVCIFIVCFLILQEQTTFVSGQTFTDTETAYNNVLLNYNKNIRPILDQSKIMYINASFSIAAINGFDEVSGELSIAGFLTVTWKDENVGWNPATAGGVGAVSVPQNLVWKPPLMLITPSRKILVMGDGMDDFMTVKLVFDGTAYWTPGAIMYLSCSVDVTYFPFDIQKCQIPFAPWGYLLNEIQFITPSPTIDLSFYGSNGEWIIASTSSAATIRGTFPVAEFTLTLERRPAYFVINVVLPILFLAALNVLVFLLPVESGERVSYAITVLLAIAVFMTIVGDVMPRSSEPMSMLSYYMMVTVIYSALITLATIVTLRIYQKGDNSPVPMWLCKFVDCMTCTKHSDVYPIVISAQPDRDGAIGVTEQGNKQPRFTEKRSLHTEHSGGKEKVTWKSVGKVVDFFFFTFFVFYIILATVVILALLGTRTGAV
jgi:hypothetical protein